MKFTLLTLFPEILDGFFSSSIFSKAADRGLVEVEVVNIRDFARDKHRSCDDTPYGGGAGMVLKTEPLAAALDSVGAFKKHVVYPSPSGVPLTQQRSARLAEQEEIVLICGRYEGVDQRIIDLYVNEEVSIGDYVISSGEIASLVVVDSVYRLLDGVINSESLQEESFHNGLLEYPHYTRPEVFKRKRVPEVLLSGNHAKIKAWRQRQQLIKTVKNRPDLLSKCILDEDLLKVLNKMGESGGQ